ncbi:hypothetical protein [Herbaspirillum sp. RV1423]|nr:hypothetical protein [Herbaspirillum sp. RV1423]
MAFLPHLGSLAELKFIRPTALQVSSQIQYDKIAFFIGLQPLSKG